MSRVLPVERSSKDAETPTPAPEPWLLHSLPVNALNFCAFTLGFASAASEGRINDVEEEAYFAVPNALNSGAIDIFHLPSERRVSTIPADQSVQTGMVMAVKIIIKKSPQDTLLYMLSGYEDGHVMVHVSQIPSQPPSSAAWKWTKTYAARPHSQPVLSLDSVQANMNQIPGCFYTSSADALIVKHPIPSISAQTPSQVESTPLKVLNTKHSGQQGLSIRSDQKIFATAGWDARIRVYSCKTMKELAVLKWHSEGCYAVSFADILLSIATKSQDMQEHSPQSSPLEVVRQQRNHKAQQTHWLAAGSKDGKISLWDIY